MRQRPQGSPFAPLRRHTVATGTKPPTGRARRATGHTRRLRGGETAEARAQKEFVRWARAHGLEVAHVNNGAKTTAQRVRLHALGCAAGAADLLIFDRLPNAPEARGLALEFKAGRGKQSQDQLDWQSRVEGHGWVYHVVYGKTEAIATVRFYGLACN